MEQSQHFRVTGKREDNLREAEEIRYDRARFALELIARRVFKILHRLF